MRELLFESGKGKLNQRTFPHIQDQYVGSEGQRMKRKGFFLLTQRKQLIIVAEKTRARLDV